MNHQLLALLREAGRTLSTQNETHLRSAVESLQKVLTALDKTATKEAREQAFSEAHQLFTEAEWSHDATRRALSAAIRAERSRDDATYIYRYVRDVYDTWFVYEESDLDGLERLYRAAYSLDNTGAALIGTPVEVRIETSYVDVDAPVSEAQRTEAKKFEGGFVRLVERAVRDDGTVPIKVISPGWGSSAYYPAEVLQRDGAKAFPKGTHMKWNHQTAREAHEQPEGDLDNVAGVLATDAAWQDNGPLGAGLYAETEVKSWYRDKVDELAADIGVSIWASGTAQPGEAEGRQGLILESLIEDPFNTVDYVTRPGAGGAVVQLFEAARQSVHDNAPTNAPTPDDANPVPNPDPIPNPDAESIPNPDETSSQENTNVTEAEIQSLRDEVARLKEVQLFNEARDIVSRTLGEIDMPALTRDRLTESLSKRPVLTDGALDKAATAQAAREAATSELTFAANAYGFRSGHVRGLGEAATGSAGQTATQLVESAEADLETAFKTMGLSDSQAKIAAKGR